jgi:hypothetical protein
MSSIDTDLHGKPNGVFLPTVRGIDLRRVQQRLLSALLHQPELAQIVLATGISQEDFPEDWRHAFIVATQEPVQAKQIVADPNGDPTIRNLCGQLVLLGHGQARQMAEQIIASIRLRDSTRRDDNRPSGPNQQQPDDIGADPQQRPQGLDQEIVRPILNTGPTDAKRLAHQTQNTHSWEYPDWSLLDDRRGQLPDFPLDTLISPWRSWTERAAKGAGVTPGHIAVPVIEVTSSLIGTARRVRASRSWSEPLTLWACIIGASGDRKTPALRVAQRALDLIEKNRSPEVSVARLAHETQVQASKEKLKKWKDERQAALAADPSQGLPAMPPDAIDPGGFISPRLYATDPTIERLASLLQARPRGMTLIRDELSALFSNMGRYSGGSDRPFWLEAWNGGRHVVERVKGSITVDHLLVGLIGGFQPDKIARAFAGDEDGMYARFLYAWPLPPDYHPLTNDVSEVEPEFQSALTALVRLPAENAEGQFVPQDIWLSEGAIERFEEFRRFIDKTKRELDGRERQWFVKGETQVLRLAGTLAYMEWVISLGGTSEEGVGGITAALEPTMIAEEFMISAIQLWREYFWPHARAALRQIGLAERHANARRVLRWIKARGKDEVSREEIRRDALGQSLDADQTQQLLDGLVMAGWLRPTSTDTTGRRKYRWLVNPRIHAPAESAESAERV